MRILHYICVYAPAWKFGGVVSWSSQLCESIVNSTHQIEVFTTNFGLEDNPDVVADQPTIYNNVKVTYFSYEKSALGIQSPQMELAIKSKIQEFDVLHISGVWQPTSIIACKIAQEFNIPYVTSLHGALCPYSWSQKTIKKILYYLWKERLNVNRANYIHYTTQQELEECRWLNLSSKPIVIPNGLDSKFWKPNKKGAKLWRQKQCLEENEFVLLNIGRLHHKKGLDLLPPVLNQIRDLKWKLFFVGGDDDGTKTNLINLFEKFNLSDRVTFLPPSAPDDLCSIYSAANLFVLPSRHENFGNVVVEALACGCPVMISDRVGLHREISRDNMGWVLKRNVGDWATAIRDIITDSTSLDKIVSKSSQYVELNYSIDKVSKDMLDCYGSLVS